MGFFSGETVTLPSYENALKLAGAIVSSAVVLRTVSDTLVPDSVTDYLRTRIRKISNRLSNQATVVIEEFDELNPNQIFEAANVYLGSKLSTSTQRTKANKPAKEKEITVTVDMNQPLVDSYENVKLEWVLVSSPIKSSVSSRKRENGTGSRSELRFFELSFHKKFKETVMSSYLPYILQQGKDVRDEKKAMKLHTVDYNGTDYWGSITFDHPASFDTMAMDQEMKKTLIDDLDKFISMKDFYRSVGKAWKRGYLLYGPPGTGKSSLVAAMANYLKFDVYDLDLKEVQCNSDLRRLLIGTSNRSILVIEDIDNSFETNEDDKVTLSGLLNFIDGLWSSCGDERILVMTTNHKDRIDPVLLRPGRMDVHLHMSYCSFSGFKTLASNYLKLEEHSLFGKIEELLKKIQATPAEIAGELMKSQDAEASLQGLIDFLINKTTGS
ncbi:hypothetical protein Ddye_007105 [Dipteronia dyeriana]|uniref:AAA+ ATPase domain-containing protein n=1 Tax=Dipteronia dyeriana TaxID=168575 RepID=A0AAD9XJX9_9ROSI|nr:hypothetical protein Ddye_007105 [Dipteronia dyeriana]